MTTPYQPAFQKRFLRPRFWLTWAGLGLAWLLAWLPAWLRDPLATATGRLILRFGQKRAAIARTNLGLCFPDEPPETQEQRLKNHFRIASKILLGYGELWFRSNAHLKQRCQALGYEHLDKARASGRTVILLTPHMLALDYGAKWLSINGVPLLGMVKAMKNPISNWLIGRSRTIDGSVAYRRKDGIRPLIRDMKKGFSFYYLPDEDHGPDQSLFVPFFGQPKATLTALHKLAKVSNAVVIPMTSGYNEHLRKFEIEFLPPLEDFPGEDEAVDTARMNEVLETLVSRYPDQYMWTLRLFRSLPDGGERY